jgi:uncharacterized protein (DUF2236 family)
MDQELKPLDPAALAEFSALICTALAAQNVLNTYALQRRARQESLQRSFDKALHAAEAAAEVDARLQEILTASGLTTWSPPT